MGYGSITISTTCFICEKPPEKPQYFPFDSLQYEQFQSVILGNPRV
jgi:hypothetical protein